MVKGMVAVKPATMIRPNDSVTVRGEEPRFVSRGGEKLDGALRQLQVVVARRRWLDAGASTGGFTQRLLQGGASEVIALDVGYGQLDWTLRGDDRVVVMERTNVRDLDPGDIPFIPEGITADLSFISLTTALPALSRVAAQDADYVLLVKPQFEVGRANVGKKGVVRDPTMWSQALDRVAARGADLGLGVAGAVLASPVGPAGNREFFLHLRRGTPHDHATLHRVVMSAS
jgi:23S rRNA (cytidine1920-2'-O)/16S rRNA (cytidine1409-2'-O)-methyltransferase